MAAAASSPAALRGLLAVVALCLSAVIAVGASSHDFMVIGDWGGVPVWPYRTPGETHVAEQLGRVAGKVDAAYTLSLGDNFYLKGVVSVDDSRFRTTFEDVFASPNLRGENHFRVLGGNHDHLGNCSAQVAYSERSERWHFPSLYYDFVEKLGSGVRVHHVMIDTVLLAGQSSHPSTGLPLPGSEYPGPASTEAAEEQWRWINATLAASTADYLVVAGHFPVWSICEHGPTALLVQRLRPLLEAARASVYLAGHDHCAEHLDEGRGVQYHGVGAGDSVDGSTKHRGAVPGGALKWHYGAGVVGRLVGAFAHVSVGEAGLVVSHYSSGGKKLYEAPPIPPRRAARLDGVASLLV